MKLILSTLFLITIGVLLGSLKKELPPVVSNYQIPIVPYTDVWNLMGRKYPEQLFDGSTAEGNGLSSDGYSGNDFVSPFKFFISLKDSVYNHLKIQWFQGFCGCITYNITLYDSNKIARGSYTMNGGYMSWNTVSGAMDTISFPIRYIWFSTNDPASDTREIKIFGDPVAKCYQSMLPAPAAQPTDPGISLLGGSAVDDKDTTYMKLSNGDPLYWAWRQPSSVFMYCYNNLATYANQPFGFHKYGDLSARKLVFYKNRNVPFQLYANGSSILTIPSLTPSDDYNTLGATGGRKDIPPGDDSTQYAPWAKNNGRFWKAVSYMWGRNTSGTLPGYSLSGTSPTSAGQNKVAICEIGNEDNAEWAGLQRYHGTLVMLQKTKAAYDSIKSIDPTMEVTIGATYFMDTTWWRGMYAWNFWLYNTTAFPCDGANFNQYVCDAYGGQPKGFNTNTAVSPEQFRVRLMLQRLAAFRDRFFPGRKFRWTEIGYGTNANSNYDVHAVTGLGDSTVAANFMLRTIALAATVPGGVQTVYNYFHTSDGSNDFGWMKMVTERFDGGGGSYSGSIKHPQWYQYAMYGQVLKNYKGWSTMLVDGDSTGVSVTRYDHLSDTKKKVLNIWKGTYSGSTSSNVSVYVGNATSVTQVVYQYGDEDGVRTSLTQTGGYVTIPLVTETNQYLIVELGDDIPPPAPLQPKIHRRIKIIP